MLPIIQRVKYKPCWFRDIVKLNNLWKSSSVNLYRGNNNYYINWNKFCTHAELSLPEKQVQNYLKSITTAYKTTMKKNIPDEVVSLINIYEVSKLLQDRLNIEDDIYNLNELDKNDEEMKKLSEQEHIEYMNTLKKIDDELLELITDNLGRNNCRDILLEISAGVGGQEAMLFAADLFKMYQGYFDYLGFTCDVTEFDADTEAGGMRHASILASGPRAYELLRHEGGVHRVQRIPATEKSGRIHTSTVSIVILPQPSDIEIKLLNKDIRVDTKTSSSPGGQNVNKVETAVRLHHMPTGITVEVQTERTQLKNKRIAYAKLHAKIYEVELENQKSESSTLRKKQRGLSQRNEKIRTYNFNQDRVTDHRLSDGTMHNLKGFLAGGEQLENLQERLQRNYQLKLLQDAIQQWK